MKRMIVVVLFLGMLMVNTGVVSGAVWFYQDDARTVAICRGGAAINLSGIYDADLIRQYPSTYTGGAYLNTALSLVTRGPIAAKDTSPLWRKLTVPEHPADNRSLFYQAGNGQLYARVFSVTGAGTANLLINLSGMNGTTYYRNISITGAGFYPILTEGYDTCRARNWTNSAYRISTFTGFTRFYLQINQSRVGVLWKMESRQGTDDYLHGLYRLGGGNLVIGYTGIKANFSMENDSLWMSGADNWTGKVITGVPIKVNSTGTWRMNNSDLYIDNGLDGVVTQLFTSVSAYPGFFLNSYVHSKGKGYFNLPSAVTTYINHTIWERSSIWNGKLSVEDSSFLGHGATYAFYNCNLVSCDAAQFINYTEAIAHKSLNWNVTNSVVSQCQYLFYSQIAGVKGRFLDCTVNTYDIAPTSTWSGTAGSVNRSTTLRVRVMNGSLPEASARVRYWNTSMSLLLDTTTNAGGYINPYVVEAQAWLHSNTPVWRTPGTINISSGNWSSNFTFNASLYGVGGINWTIGVGEGGGGGGGGATVYIPLNRNNRDVLWMTLGLCGGTLFGVVPLVRWNRKKS